MFLRVSWLQLCGLSVFRALRVLRGYFLLNYEISVAIAEISWLKDKPTANYHRLFFGSNNPDYHVNPV